MKKIKKELLKVTVDKRHVISIGEKLYAESVELIRELVNNAYDADASEVNVSISPDCVIVSDNGSGMDMEGLKQYFIIGSDEKVIHSRSPRYDRVRIGQFGIGKFASLAAANRFEVITQHKDFAARVVFDKDEWENNSTEWHLPCEILEPDIKKRDGTIVKLLDLTRQFDVEDVEKKILDGTPLRAPEFVVYLNGRRLYPRSLKGQIIPVLEGTNFGPITGEIIIVPSSQASMKELGIAVKVKGVTVKRELFGMESWGKAVSRIKGEINADFLPITSDRSKFITDSSEFQEFIKIMEKIVGIIKKSLGKEADRRKDRRAGTAAKEALQRIHKALARNPDLSPFGPISYGDEEKTGTGGSAALSDGKKKAYINDKEISPDLDKSTRKMKNERKKRRNPLVKKITANAIVRRMRMGTENVSVCMDFFGEKGPECFSEGNIVYINRDHLLFKRESRKTATFTMYITRLVTQEISMFKETKSPRVAFNRQSKLLKDAFAED